MSNCGEYRLDHRSLYSPNCAISYYKLLEAVLYDGTDPASGKPMGLSTGRLSDFRTFEDLWTAYKIQAEHFIRIITDKMANIYRAMEADAPNLFDSLLFDDCLASGKGLIAGARYLGYDMETHTIVSTADSLTALKKLLFDKPAIQPDVLLEMLKNDFVNSTTSEQAERLGVRFCLASHVSVNAGVYLGLNTGASPDGRHAYGALSNSINPLPGRDRNGVTALPASMAKIGPDLVAGQVHHLKVTPDMFTKYRDKLETALEAFFSMGGGYLCIDVVNHGALKDAMENPELYPELMVRVGGFSAQFTFLANKMQEEILSRSLY